MGKSMAAIFKLQTAREARGACSPRPSAELAVASEQKPSATLLLFTGVRYERLGQPEARRVRDVLELAD
jgi:hypothetical protein